jgi:membrane-associated protease RseP (regulator of RpoE activity)
MRGVNLDVFDFDYDLTWAAFFLSPGEEVYGRYGGRDAISPDARTSLAGLRHAMIAALAAHRQTSSSNQPGLAGQMRQARTPDQYAAAKRRAPDACIHCHHVYDFRRESLQADRKWTLDELWVYPLPENVGLTLNVDEGDRIASVAADSSAGRAGLRPGDRVSSVNGVSVASLADVQYGLHRAPAEGAISIVWTRQGSPMTGRLSLAEGWRKTDISWRWSLRGLEPSAWVHGEDLTPAERKRLGLSEKQLAFYQGSFVPTPARQAGLRQKDIVIGIDGKHLEMTERQFLAFVKLNYKVGDRVTYNIIRDGKYLDVPMTLAGRPLF